MRRTYRVALVGCGTISKNHLVAIGNTDGTQVVALCDTKIERAKKRALEFASDAICYDDYVRMLDEAKPDAVHICTPHYLHCEMAIEALKRNIFVFLEKPLCTKYEQIDQLIKAEKESDASACVCFQNRFSPSVVRAKEIIAADGGPVGGYANVFWDRDEKYYTESGWRGSLETEGGGVMINQAIHSIDLLLEIMGDAATIKAHTANYHLPGIIDVEDSCGGMITHKNGLVSNFYATTAAKGISSTVVYIQTAAKRVIEIRNYKLYVSGELVDTSESGKFIGKACYGSGHEPLIRSFYAAIDAGCAMPVTIEDSAGTIKLLLAAYRSDDAEIPVI